MSFCTLSGFRHFELNPLESMAGTTGLEPATSAVTGQHSNQLNYVPAMQLDALRNLVAIDDYRFRIQVTFRTGSRRFPPCRP
jgi:hypothetical protein